MSKIRFSIASLLIIVLWCAFALGALRAADALWDQIVFSVTSVLLLTAVLLAIHRTEHSRAFWLGCALFGWAYFVASQIPSVQSRLITNPPLAYAAGRLISEQNGVSYSLGWLTLQNDPNVMASLPSLPEGKSLAAGGWEPVAFASASDAKPLASGTWDNVVLRWPWSASLSGAAATAQSFITIGHLLLAWVVALVGGGLSRALFARRRSQRRE